MATTKTVTVYHGLTRRQQIYAQEFVKTGDEDAALQVAGVRPAEKWDFLASDKLKHAIEQARELYLDCKAKSFIASVDWRVAKLVEMIDIFFTDDEKRKAMKLTPKDFITAIGLLNLMLGINREVSQDEQDDMAHGVKKLIIESYQSDY